VLCVFAELLLAQSFEQEFRRGLLALGANDFAQARQSLENASRLSPDNAMVWTALAQTYLKEKEPTLAKEAAARASRLASADSPVNHALAIFYSEIGDLPKAATAERLYASSKSADTEAAARAAELSMRAGDAASAIPWAKTALGRSDSAPMHHLLSEAYAATNQPEDAERELSTAIQDAPQVEAYAAELGQIQLRRGNFPGAAITLETACQRFPNSAQIHLAYGVAAYGQRRFAAAIDAFLRVIAIDPSVEQSYVFLARILDQSGERLPQIIAAFSAWAKAEPGNYLAACLHAKALSAASVETAAVESELRRSIHLNASYWECHYELGVLLETRRAWKEAADELSRSIELNPKAAASHFQLARAYEKLGQTDLARVEREEHQRLTAAETGAGEAMSSPRGNPLP
jgi:predicted Zn-dependent protease